MNKTKRTTANLPSQLLKEATRITGEGITETLIRGLKLIKRSEALEKARALRGNINIDLDLDTLRERTNN
jgi:hypothetical protein